MNHARREPRGSSRPLQTPPRAALWATLALWGCSTGQGCGSVFEPLPSRFDGERLEHAATVRLTDAGVGFLNQNAELLLGELFPGNELLVPVPCALQNNLLLGDLALADEGAAGCTQESCGRLDGKCDCRDVPAVMRVRIRTLSLTPRPPNEVEASLTLGIDTGQLAVSTASRNHYLCAFTAPVKCLFKLDSALATPVDNELVARVQLTIDTRWQKLLRFSLSSLDGLSPCGLGAPPKPRCLDPADVDIQAAGSCPSCNAADWGPVKFLLMALIQGSLRSTLEAVIDRSNCETCGALSTCPKTASASSSCQLGGSSCSGPVDAGLCHDAVAGRCVPRVLGVEGRLRSAALPVVESGDAGTELAVAAGGSLDAVRVDNGLWLSFSGGARAKETSDCVPLLPEPSTRDAGVAPLDRDAPGPYQLGAGVSADFLGRALHHAHQAGALCLRLDTQSIDKLQTGTLRLVLPSLAYLTSKEDAPALVVLRPQTPPRVLLGQAPSLVTLSLSSLNIDVYALLEDRYARLFTVDADVSLPLSLEFDACGRVTPLLGDLDQMVTRVAAVNSELLAEPPGVIEKLVPLFVSLAEPQLAKGLGKLELPSLAGLRVVPTTARGIGSPSAQGYPHLGLYGRLERADVACQLAAPRLSARLVRLDRSPPASPEGGPLELPAAVFELALNSGGPLEVSYRVDDGLWSTFRKAEPDGRFAARHPSLLLDVDHILELRARTATSPHAVSMPVSLRVPRRLP